VVNPMNTLRQSVKVEGGGSTARRKISGSREGSEEASHSTAKQRKTRHGQRFPKLPSPDLAGEQCSRPITLQEFGCGHPSPQKEPQDHFRFRG